MPAEITAFAPGRVNLIGEHTDYSAGLALPFAIQEGVTVRAWARADPVVQAVAVDLDGHDEFDLSAPPPARGWRAFVRGTVAELQRAGVRLPGARLEISGTLARGSGLSSSAALEVAVALALHALAGEAEPDRLQLAKLGSRVENDWVGAQTGLLDQMASLYGQADRALRIDFQTLDVEPIELALGDFRLATLDSGESHSNAASGYNERRRECAAARRQLRVPSLRQATLPAAQQLPEPLDRRVRHVVSENARVEAAVQALRAGDLPEVGRLLNASHASLRDDYEVSTPAVEATVARCRDAGAIGARIMGGGFGGQVLALLAPGARAPRGSVEVRPGPGAHLLVDP